eukprot:1920214-Amphidinium_carterae.1
MANNLRNGNFAHSLSKGARHAEVPQEWALRLVGKPTIAVQLASIGAPKDPEFFRLLVVLDGQISLSRTPLPLMPHSALGIHT